MTFTDRPCPGTVFKPAEDAARERIRAVAAELERRRLANWVPPPPAAPEPAPPPAAPAPEQEPQYNTPLEPDAEIVGLTRAQAELLVTLVKFGAGHRCDSIERASRPPFGPDFRLRCNDGRYSYEINDVGGRWEITVKR